MRTHMRAELVTEDTRARRALKVVLLGSAPLLVERGLAAFSEGFRPQRKLLVGADGIPVEEFLLQPVEHWVKA